MSGKCLQLQKWPGGRQPVCKHRQSGFEMTAVTLSQIGEASQITFSYFINADRLPDYIAIYLSQAARMQHISLQTCLLHCYIK